MTYNFLIWSRNFLDSLYNTYDRFSRENECSPVQIVLRIQFVGLLGSSSAPSLCSTDSPIHPTVRSPLFANKTLCNLISRKNKRGDRVFSPLYYYCIIIKCESGPHSISKKINTCSEALWIGESFPLCDSLDWGLF